MLHYFLDLFPLFFQVQMFVLRGCIKICNVNLQHLYKRFDFWFVAPLSAPLSSSLAAPLSAPLFAGINRDSFHKQRCPYNLITSKWADML